MRDFGKGGMGSAHSIVIITQHGLRLALLAALLFLSACDRREGETAAGRQAKPPSGDRVVAIVDGSPVRASELETPLRLELHDLELARHQMLIRRLHQLVARHLGDEILPGSPEWAQRVEIRLAPPPPPRLEIPDGDGPIRGSAAGSVTIVEFLDYESPHCRRLQPILLRLLETHQGYVRLRVRDFPRAYHRNAYEAAVAARCAEEQGSYWDYHDVLLLEQPDLSPMDLARYAQHLGLEVERFESCRGSGRHDIRIAADLALGESLGVHRTPTVFVNGLYLGRQPGYEEIDAAIRSEMEGGRRTTSGLTDPKEGDRKETRIGPGRNGEPPLLPLPGVPLDELPAPEVILSLSRAEVEAALEEREALDRKLEASSGVFSGQRLLKLRAIDERDFYARLGLEEGDVLMLVNGRFVTREQGSIWDAFEQGDVVTLLVMRRGLPHTYRYRIGHGALERGQPAR